MTNPMSEYSFKLSELFQAAVLIYRQGGDIDLFRADYGPCELLTPINRIQDSTYAPNFAYRLKVIDSIWHVATDPFRTFRERVGVTREAFAFRYAISLRTLETWEQRDSCPPHIRYMLAELLGFLEFEPDEGLSR